MQRTPTIPLQKDKTHIITVKTHTHISNNTHRHCVQVITHVIPTDHHDDHEEHDDHDDHDEEKMKNSDEVMS